MVYVIRYLKGHSSRTQIGATIENLHFEIKVYKYFFHFYFFEFFKLLKYFYDGEEEEEESFLRRCWHEASWL